MSDARAVFERTISKIPANKAKPLWDRWARYECQFSDLSAIQKLDARIAEAYPEGVPIPPSQPNLKLKAMLASAQQIFRFAERHVYQGLTEMLTKDLGLLPTGAAAKREARSPSASRSPSPPYRANKRGPSEDRYNGPPGVGGYRRRSPSPERRFGPAGGLKRMRRDSMSPPPHRRGPPPPQMRGRPMSPQPGMMGGGPGPRRFPSPPRGGPGGGRYEEENRLFDEIPEAVVFFMSILPNKITFNGECLRRAPSIVMS